MRPTLHGRDCPTLLFRSNPGNGNNRIPDAIQSYATKRVGMTVAPQPPSAHDPEPFVAKSDVAACLNLSHELRTPANAILGHVDLLLSGSAGALSTEMRMSLGEIQKAALALQAQLGTVIRLAEEIPMPLDHRTAQGPEPKEQELSEREQI